MLKITGGKFKNKKLESINKLVRPTSSLKREAFFSIIDSYSLKNSYNFYNKKIFLDLFAGFGTMGLEAISRGFDSAIFYENNENVIKILEKNCKKLCNIDQYEIIEKDILKSEIDICFDNISIIYIDPPYNKYNLTELLRNLQNKVGKKIIIGIETSINDKYEIPNKLKIIKKKKYGKTNLDLLVLA